MPFSDIKVLFKEASGREDLLETAGASVLNAIAKAATEYLDLHFGSDSFIAESWYKIDVAAGDVIVEVPGVREISEVWVTNSEGELTQLTKKLYKELRKMYSEQSADVDQDTPVYYAVLVHRLAPSQLSLTSGTNTDFTQDTEFTLYGEQHTQKAIAILPPPDEAYTISVKGTFFSNPPTDNDDTNYWIANHPMTFVHAMLRELEVFYRNFEGVKAWEAAIMQKLSGIDSDIAAMAAGETSVMEG